MHNRRLVLADGAASRHLEELLRLAAAGFAKLPEDIQTSLRVSSATDELVVSFVPTVSNHIESTRAAVAIVVIRERQAPLSLSEKELRVTYGLTPAEAGLALALARGETLDAFTRTRKVSINTARSQLKQVLQKTGASRQADLVRILLTMHVPIE